MSNDFIALRTVGVKTPPLMDDNLCPLPPQPNPITFIKNNV